MGKGGTNKGIDMYIKKIMIEKNGKVTQRYNFSESLNVVPNNTVVYNIIEVLLGIQRPKRYPYNIRFFAVVEFDSICYIRGRKDKGESTFTISVYKENEETDFFEEYYNFVIQNSEMEDALFFHHFKKEDYPHKLLKYRNLFKYYPDGDFAALTNGYGTTRSFRGFITDYIKRFEPIKLRNDKEFFLKLSDNGEFNVGYLDSNEKVFLSESENILYHYLSFLCIADFWDRAEEIRNFNRIEKPLIISSFLERLDSSIDVTEILQRTNALSRQAIILVPNSVQNSEYTI